MINLKTVKQLVDERYEGTKISKFRQFGDDWSTDWRVVNKWYYGKSNTKRKTLMLMNCFDTEAEAEEYAEHKQMKERVKDEY
jgi:hypothetical protein